MGQVSILSILVFLPSLELYGAQIVEDLEAGLGRDCCDMRNGFVC
jgi:hypothetical protein